MKKVILMALMLLAVCSYALYNPGEAVLPEDNISWTISGPAGSSELGKSSDLFTMIDFDQKAVMIFCGTFG